jgi:hypothetical protein
MANSHSLDFNGTDEGAETKTVSHMAALTQGTIEFWAKNDADSGAEQIPFGISRDTGSVDSSMWISFDGRAGADDIYIKLTLDDPTQWAAKTAADSLDAYINQWVHVAIVHNGTAPKLYLNAVEQSLTFTVEVDKTKWLKAIITDATNKADTLSTGYYAYLGSNEGEFDGHVDEVRIWNDVRTSTEIANYYKRQLTGTEDGLVYYWKLDNAYTDSTSNGNTLTGINTPTFSTDVPFTTDTPLPATGALFYAQL